MGNKFICVPTGTSNKKRAVTITHAQCQKKFAPRHQFSNALVSVIFDHLRVCEVKEASVHFGHHFSVNLSVSLFFFQGVEV